MNTKLRLLRDVATAALDTVRRRTLEGPRQPSWSWSYEIFVETLRIQIRNGKKTDIPAQRRAMDGFGRDMMRGITTHTTPVNAGGVDAEWVSTAPDPTAGPVILFLHGGAYTVGSPTSHRRVTTALASATGGKVLALDYRLGPEHACPAAIEDAVAAYDWLLQQGVQPQNIAIAGDSAGGGLTVASLVALRDAGRPLPACAVPISPWTDLTVEADNERLDIGCDTVPLGVFEHEAKGYAGPLDRADPRVSPRFADLRHLPPLFVMAGGAEVLLHDAIDLHERAKAAGVPCTLHIEPEEVHVHIMFLGMSQRAQAGIERIAEFVTFHTHRQRQAQAEVA